MIHMKKMAIFPQSSGVLPINIAVISYNPPSQKYFYDHTELRFL